MEHIKSSGENQIKISEGQNGEVNVNCNEVNVLANDQFEVFTNNMSLTISNANYISSENLASQRNTPNENNWEDILNGELDSNCLPKTRGQISTVNLNISEMLKPTMSNILRADSENSEMRQTKQEIHSALKSLQTNLLLISLVLLLSVLYFAPSSKWQLYFTTINESLQKGLLPTLTTIANFGSIQSVILKYWEFSRNRIHPS